MVEASPVLIAKSEETQCAIEVGESKRFSEENRKIGVTVESIREFTLLGLGCEESSFFKWRKP